MRLRLAMKKIIAVVILGASVSSCGPELLLAGGGIGGTGISWGAVVAFGSVNVNGVHYDTTKLENPSSDDDDGIWLDGNKGSYSQLKVGMVVRVHGTNNGDGTGTATGLEYWSLAKGPAAVFMNNGDGSGELTMFGLKVVVPADTVFNDRRDTPTIVDFNTLDYVADGSVYLEVSGYQAPVTSNNTIYANRIEIKRDWIDGDEVRLMGTVGSVSSGTSFTIGGQTIYYNGVSSSLQGKYVEVEGVLNGSTFSADSVEQESLGVNGNEDEEFELEGVVTSAVSSNLFTLNGQRVRITAGTEFEPIGKGIGDLGIGTEVEAEGYFDANNVLVAVEIEFEEHGSEIEGEPDTISSVDTMGKTLTLSGGLVLTIDNETEIRDERDNGNEQFTFGDFVEGGVMSLKYKYYVSGSDNIATRIEVVDP